VNRAEYMKELAYLLQDVPDGEREEALQYYEDYFDDAGPEREEQVIAELGRPEKVAAIIREGASNGYESPDAEYTENGYRNERYRGPHYEIVPPEQVERKQIGGGDGPTGFSGQASGTGEGNRDAGTGTGGREYRNTEEDSWGERARTVFEELGERISEGAREGRRRLEESRERRRQEDEKRRAASGQTYDKDHGQAFEGNRGYGQNEGGAGCGGFYGSPNAPVRRRRSPFLWFLMILGLLLLSPFLLGAAALMFGLFLVVICVAGGIALVVVVLAAAFVVTGIILFGVGIGKLFLFPPAGMMIMAAGLILFGLGVLSVWLSVLVCGRLIPGVVRMIGNLFSFFGRRRRGVA